MLLIDQRVNMLHRLLLPRCELRRSEAPHQQLVRKAFERDVLDRKALKEGALELGPREEDLLRVEGHLELRLLQARGRLGQRRILQPRVDVESLALGSVSA